ncbi:hypothetical protein GIB67_029969 [Kingdonia uniflora]|uniref:Squalene monooxygenase n=1 Tax=Kingdonia uniflora TaxID=39325 RepID=A0A7J7MXN6_9MAGN|nr:hypothetical protein GIB67_029969 [Kingdonia uniflora]
MGDAFNMRHPLTGGGMTVALSDIVVLHNLLKPLSNLNDASSLCKYLESFYTLRKPVASTINTLAGALYKVFCASPDQARVEMRQACFDYLSLGGVFTSGPVALLSGLNPRPLSLVCHFFAVAIYGVGRLLLPFPSPKRIWIGARLISVRCIKYHFSNYKGGRSQADVFPSYGSSVLLQSSSYQLKEKKRDNSQMGQDSRGCHEKRHQGTVTSLLEENGTIKGIIYKTEDAEGLKAYAPLTIVCDGCSSNLRRSLCSPKVEVLSCFVGLVLENCELPYPSHGHVIIADPSPICLYPISSTEVRCLVDIPGQKVPSISNGDMANYLKTVVAPQLPHQLHGSFIAAIEKGRIRHMPNRSMPAAPHPIPGALLMGDAFNMRHSLTGGGMTVALSDTVVLHSLLKPLRNLNDVSSLCKYLESFYTLRKPVASTINTLAEALYKVFCASTNQARVEMRQACFDYLSLGGVFTSGPVALLSGLNPRPLSLVCHFFAVAIYGIGRLILPFPSPKRLWIGARLISVRSIEYHFSNYKGGRSQADVFPSYGSSILLQSSSYQLKEKRRDNSQIGQDSRGCHEKRHVSL